MDGYFHGFRFCSSGHCQFCLYFFWTDIHYQRFQVYKLVYDLKSRMFYIESVFELVPNRHFGFRVYDLYSINSNFFIMPVCYCSSGIIVKVPSAYLRLVIVLPTIDIRRSQSLRTVLVNYLNMFKRLVTEVTSPQNQMFSCGPRSPNII